MKREGKSKEWLEGRTKMWREYREEKGISEEEEVDSDIRSDEKGEIEVHEKIILALKEGKLKFEGKGGESVVRFGEERGGDSGGWPIGKKEERQNLEGKNEVLGLKKTEISAKISLEDCPPSQNGPEVEINGISENEFEKEGDNWIRLNDSQFVDFSKNCEGLVEKTGQSEKLDQNLSQNTKGGVPQKVTLVKSRGIVVKSGQMRLPNGQKWKDKYKGRKLYSSRRLKSPPKVTKSGLFDVNEIPTAAEIKLKSDITLGVPTGSDSSRSRDQSILNMSRDLAMDKVVVSDELNHTRTEELSIVIGNEKNEIDEKVLMEKDEKEGGIENIEVNIRRNVIDTLKDDIVKPVKQRHLYPVFNISKDKPSQIENLKPNRRSSRRKLKDEKLKDTPNNEKPHLMKLFDKMKSLKEVNREIDDNEFEGLVADKNIEEIRLIDENSRILDEKHINKDGMMNEKNDGSNEILNNEPLISANILRSNIVDGHGMSSIIVENDEKYTLDEKYDPLYDNNALFRGVRNAMRSKPENFMYAEAENKNELDSCNVVENGEKISVLDENVENKKNILGFLDENKTFSSLKPPPELSKTSPKTDQKSLETGYEKVCKSIVRLPHHEKKPKLIVNEKKEKKVKTRVKALKISPQTPITRFFMKRNAASIKDTPGKRKRTSPENSKDEKKKRLGTDYKLGAEAD